ncbi:site-specific DNA-methyltransferase [Methylacidimicrobium sp. B4]|uniref:site-specific DNA-methyltransferase n=1 Tax=Methylacidimicrobium sp. B4 TaxID=2796139 RepID=UPI001A8F7A27|nr:site-specific DNA-methyltransferase [Methylacidimicrobium sp. B4]QSR84871.1 site-specific DNA-methyltransferase [Methylacidimicrobium sp. B4]
MANQPRMPERFGEGSGPEQLLREWLLARIAEAAALPPPHRFPRPQELVKEGRPPVRVEGLSDAVERLCRLARPGRRTEEAGFRSAGAPPPLFCRERISAERIVRTMLGKEDERELPPLLGSYGFPGGWENRLIWGDSLLVLKSLLFREGREGEVQTVYFDPPYGVNFPSCFEPFARRRGEAAPGFVRVKAYRDAWEQGLPSYLAHLRERLLLCRALLHPTGSLFLQIGEENLHHVRILLDEVFGERNFVSLISFRKTSAFPGKLLRGVSDYLLWYARQKERVKYHPLYQRKRPGAEGASNYRWVELPDGKCRALSPSEEANPDRVPPGARIFALGDLRSAGASERGSFAFPFAGRTFRPYANSHWKTTREGMERLAEMGRLVVSGRTLMYKRYLSDFPVVGLTNHWSDVRPSFQRNRRYVVETVEKVVERCLLMTTDPGDLVLDPTCGSGTTAAVAERWGRRWICIDAAPVPLALTRMRLLTSVYPYHALRDPVEGPAGGFLYARRQNGAGEEVGGIVPHLTLEAIAKDQPAEEEVLVDCPELATGRTRLSGPFLVEGLMPVNAEGKSSAEEGRSFAERMREALGLSPVFAGAGRKRIPLEKIRAPDWPSVLGAEGVVAGKRVGIVFGLETEPIGEDLVRKAAREASRKGYRDLYLVGFSIDAGGLERLRKLGRGNRRLHYVQASLDLLMGGLLKWTRSSQIFWLSGLPQVRVRRKPGGEEERWQVEIVGMAFFDPLTRTLEQRRTEELPAWFLDTDYDGSCFLPREAFFPRTEAWEAVGRALGATRERGDPEGRRSSLFRPGKHRRIAVKTIDERGTELLVVRTLPRERVKRPGVALDLDFRQKNGASDAAGRGQKRGGGLM